MIVRGSKLRIKPPKAGSSGIVHGYPSGGPFEPDVVFQVLFDQSASPITDVVNGLSLTESGDPSYETEATGIHASLGPGVTYDGVNDRHTVTGLSSPAMEIGTNDFTLEFWFSTTNTTSGEMFALSLNSPTTHYYSVKPANDSFTAFINGDLSNYTFTIGMPNALYNDGELHKVRFVVIRNGASSYADLYLDEKYQGRSFETQNPANSIAVTEVSIGAQSNNAFDFDGTIYGMRLSHNSTNNSGPNVTEYRYGHPEFTPPTESQVAVQWVFDEASGNLTTGLGPDITVVGSPTYQVDPATGAFDPLGPGITVDSSNKFSEVAANSDLDFLFAVGTTIEIVYQSSDATGQLVFLDTTNGSGVGYVVYADCASNTINMDIKDDSANTANISVSKSGGEVADGETHKLRIVVDTSGANVATIHFDGVSLGTGSVSSIVDDATVAETHIGSNRAGTEGQAVTLFEMRKTDSLVANSGGPGGG